MGSIKDKSIHDVEANVSRELGEAKEAVEETVEHVVNSVKHVSPSTNQKVLLGAGLAVLASAAVTALINKYRRPLAVVQNFETIVVDSTPVEGDVLSND